MIRPMRGQATKLRIALGFALALSLWGCSGKEAPDDIDNGKEALAAEQSAEAATKSDDSSAEAQDGTAREASAEPADPPAPAEGREMSEFYIQVNGRSLAVEPQGNSSAAALLALLAEGDIVVNARDYGDFEKVGALPQSLPTNDEPITTEPGDVILYQGDQITVYYDENSWNFTRLGKIKGVSAEALRDILGDGDVELRLSLE